MSGTAPAVAPPRQGTAWRAAVRRIVPSSVRGRLRATAPWTVRVAEAAAPTDDLGGRSREVLDAGARQALDVRLLADPFAVHRRDGWWLFVEAVGHDRRGRIEVLASADGRTWTPRGTALREPFHLSYPLLLADRGAWWMLPESAADGVVRLYRCRRWPDVWERDRVLLEGRPFRDATVTWLHGLWWMFVETSPRATNDELRLYLAASLRGPWTEHPASPVVRDPARARPAGRIFRHAGALWRPAQDCARTYGSGVAWQRIVTLDPERYREVPGPASRLRASGDGWNARGMHHLDVHRDGEGWRCFIDGLA